MKLTKRKAFNFLRSYFDVLNELKDDSDKLHFLMSIINKQFLNEDPKDLDFIANLCYESQRHAIEKSVKGWLTANKTDLEGNPTPPPTPPPTLPKGSPLPPPPKEVQEQEEEQEEEQVQVQEERKDIHSRKLTFSQSTSKLFDCEYPNDKHHLDDFVEYWTEHGDNDKKMRFEKQKSFSTTRRVKTWIKNNFNNINHGTREQNKQTAISIGLSNPNL